MRKIKLEGFIQGLLKLSAPLLVTLVMPISACHQSPTGASDQFDDAGLIDNDTGEHQNTDASADHDECLPDNGPTGVTFSAGQFVFSIDANRAQSRTMYLVNNDLCPRTVHRIQLINPISDVAVALETALPIEIGPEETTPIAIVFDPSQYARGTAQITMGAQVMADPKDNDKVTSATGITLHITPPDTPALPDLAIYTSDLKSDKESPSIGEEITIDAKVKNLGTGRAESIVIELLDTNEHQAYQTIEAIDPGETVELQFATTFQESSYRITQIVIDPENQLEELDKTNNTAMKLTMVQGRPGDNTTATLDVIASTNLGCRGGWAYVTGSAKYVITNERGQLEHVVQGGIVSATVLETGAVFSFAHTLVDGTFLQPIISPNQDGTYHVLVQVTDTTITGTFETILPVNGQCQDNGNTGGGYYDCDCENQGGSGDGGDGGYDNGGGIRDPRPDVFVCSQHIQFSNDTPDENDKITVTAEVFYRGDEPVYDIPVQFTAHVPINENLVERPFGQSIVSFPNGGIDGPAIAVTKWQLTQTGPQIMEITIAPTFDQNPWNDSATRLLNVADKETDICQIINCDDFNPCTQDSCQKKDGCVHAAVNNGDTCMDYGDRLGICTSGSCIALICDENDDWCPILCLVDEDCPSLVCGEDGICAEAACNDEIRNGSESDTDCGGDQCRPCPDQSRCEVFADCLSGICLNAICQESTCSDLVANGMETDVDCGGENCLPCADSMRCERGADCTSGVCTFNICQEPTCFDEVMNGQETGIDRGGVCPVDRVVLVAYDGFDLNSGRLPTRGLPENMEQPLTREAGFPSSGYIYPVSNILTGSISTGAWHNGENTKSWQIKVNTTGYTSLQVSSKQRSSPSMGPRDFKVQCSVNGSTWLDSFGNMVTAADNFSEGRVSSLDLHESCANQPLITIRWVMSSNTSVDGERVRSAGNSNIKNVLVTGLSLD